MKDLISGLNKVFDSRIRIGIMSILMVHEFYDFINLREALNVTDGNLASHLKALEEKKLIKVDKQFIGRKPNTRYSVTGEGIRLFKKHLEALEDIINAT
jgi:DNA-binding MarR family transcriptional regulator